PTQGWLPLVANPGLCWRTLSALAWAPHRGPSATTSPLAFMGDALRVCSSVRPPERLAAPEPAGIAAPPCLSEA
ncbi:MAG: hypothetical protein K2X38_12035, partial [Gemmataceae bacterium]|nr:hypothetical protein [Gemmataceae bacterium]